LNQEPVAARPASKLYRFQKLVRRNKLVFAAAGAVAAALVLGIMISTWQALRATHAKHDALAARAKAVEAQANEAKLQEQAQAQELVARQRAYASDMNVAKQALAGNNLGRALDLLNRQRPGPGQKDLRGWEWRCLWQQTRSDALFTLCQEPAEIYALAVSPDGNFLAIGAFHKGGLTVWDLRTRQALVRLAGNEGFVRAAFSPTEPLLAFAGVTLSSSGETRETLHLWNLTTRQMTAEYPLDGECLGLTFSKDGRTLATSTQEGQITLWRMPEGTKPASYPSKQSGLDPSASFATTPDSSLAAYAIGRGQICVIDLRDGKKLWKAAAAEVYITALAFSPDGKTLASAGGFAESGIRLWDVATGKETGRLDGHGSWVSSLVFWPDGNKLASSSADQTIRTWDVASRKCLDVLRGHRQEVWRLALLPDDKTLVSGGKDGTVCFWDASLTHLRQPCITIPENVLDWYFTPDSRSVLTLSKQGQVSRWSGADFQQKEPLVGIWTNLNLYESYCVSPDVRYLAVVTTNGVLQIWNVWPQVLRRQWTNTTGHVAPLCFLADGSKLITWSSGDLLREWDLTTGSEIQSWLAPRDFSIWALSPDERWWVGISYEGGTFVRNLIDESNAKVSLDHLEGMYAKYSPDGRLFAVASALGYARVWDAATWRQEATLGGFLNGANSIAFSPDGKRLAIASGGKEAVKLCDTASWQDVLILEGQGYDNRMMAFSPHGNVIGWLNDSGVLHLWRAPSWEEINTAEAREKAAQASGP
jgi:WD40 repeat protein